MAMKQGVVIMPQDKGNPRKDAYGVFPNTLKSEGGEMVGIQASGYLDPKGTPDGMWDQFNFLPPGQDIDKQSIADIRPMKMVTVTPLGYPGDGWD